MKELYFTIYLPQPQIKLYSMKKILIIEDNDEVRENTAEIIELSNYEVITAENGKWEWKGIGRKARPYYLRYYDAGT